MAANRREDETCVTSPTHREAFLFESEALLFGLALALVVLVGMLGLSVQRSHQSAMLDSAVHAAANVAERFSADPTTVATESVEEGYRVICDIVPERIDSGTFYRAIITVWDNDEVIYTIQAARYISEVER